MEKSYIFDCFIIGNGSLVIPCGEYLMEHGGKLLGIITSSYEIIEWCRINNIMQITEDRIEEIKKIDFDYLFSIAYLEIIPENIINLPRKLAINYHDSLLPSYAGIHATSWAIIEGEKRHGITWHEIKSELDTGNILIQKIIDIEPNETAVSLNKKCFQLALQGFYDLICDICNNNISSTPQDLLKRSYFGKWKKPSAAGVINWNLTVGQIQRFVTGLEFGKYDNTLITPKIMINNNLYIVDEIEIMNTNDKTQLGMGQVINGFLYVQAKDGLVKIKRLTNLIGEKIEINRVLSNKNELDNLNMSSHLIKTLTEYTTIVAKHEPYWVNKLSKLFCRLPLQEKTLEEFKSDNITLLNICHVETGEQITYSEKLLLAIQIAMMEVNNEEYITIGYIQESKNINQDFYELCEKCVPFNLNLNRDLGLKEQLIEIRGEKSEVSKHLTYMKDIFKRYSALRKNTFNPLITVNFTEKKIIDQQGILLFNYDDKIHCCECIYNHKLDIYGEGRDILKRIVDLMKIFSEDDIAIIKKDNSTFLSTYELVMKQVEKQQNKTAVVFKEKQLSYIQLKDLIDKRAAILYSKGVRKGKHVGVLLKRSHEIVISFLAMMKLGAIYIPMDPIYPLDRLKYMLKDGDVKYLLSEHSLEALLPHGTFEVVYIDDIENEKIDPKNQISPVELYKRDTVYMIYTSGSTGKPKGVVVNHGGLSNFLCSMRREPGFYENDKLLALTTICFDIAALELLLPLVSGGQVEIVESDILIDGRLLREKMETASATIIQATPATWNMLLMSGWDKKLDIKILCGGEKLSTNIAENLIVRCNELWNMYGPTETTIWSTIKHITNKNEINIGKPIDNTQIYILDEDCKPVEYNQCGELYIGGEGIANEYYNQEELTKEKFIKNPLKKGERIYKTGDLVKLKDNGELYYLGRIDNQVKYHGYRVELEEVECILQEKLQLKKAVVVLREYELGNATLSAFIQSNDPGKCYFNMEELSSFLPHYMLPSEIYEVIDFPLTENNKINRKYMEKAPIEDLLDKYCVNEVCRNIVNKNCLDKINEASRESSYAMYSTLELSIKQIWEDVLNKKITNKDIAFFDAGGDSLSLNRIRNELEKKFSIKISIVDLLRFNTISKICGFFENKNDITDLVCNNNVNKRKEFLRKRSR